MPGHLIVGIEQLSGAEPKNTNKPSYTDIIMMIALPFPLLFFLLAAQVAVAVASRSCVSSALNSSVLMLQLHTHNDHLPNFHLHLSP